MSENWTKGPWEIVDLRHQKNGKIRVLSGVSDIANVLLRDADDPVANAQLIAAAPEMYEALRAVDAWENPSCFDKVKAALKKARGAA